MQSPNPRKSAIQTRRRGDGLGTHGWLGGAVRPHGRRGGEVRHARADEGSGRARTGGAVERWSDEAAKNSGDEHMFATAHKHLKTVIMVATRSLDDKGWVIVGGYGLRLLRVVFLLSLWRVLLPETGEVSGLTRDAVLTYTLIAEVFAGQISIRTGLDSALWHGDIANRFLRPVGIYGQFIAEMFGAGLPNLVLFSLPLFCLAPLLGVDPLPQSVLAGGLFFVSLILGIAIGAAFDFIFASLMVLLEQSVYALMQIRDAVSVLLSGAIIPLALMPWGIGDILTYLPFASLASAPLRIYTGTGDPAFLIGLQAVWAIILWPVAHRFWNANRERLVSHGG